MAPSGIRAFFDLVLGMRDVISLGVGEPDFLRHVGFLEHLAQSPMQKTAASAKTRLMLKFSASKTSAMRSISV